MKNLDDFTDFENRERNGWENDIGSLDGILKTEEGPNTFWSGKLEWRPTHTFMPSLAKMFTLPGGEQGKGNLETSFKYRVHPPEPGEATEISVTVTDNVSLGHNSFFIDKRTPHGKWLQSSTITFPYSGTRAHVLIGTRGVDGTAVSRKIDIDDIKVVQVPNQ
ncbi:hypothetical protein [Pseudomonas batumici]|uniref:hypothetical protein n=1 Tax=Pseudomonas batumici TaxID=226910 RepID=UPI000589C23D|nr:hypothetical protein [Pseudomonas batumici]